MRITLISTILFDLGLYTLAPQLQKKGFDVKLLFIPALIKEYGKPLSDASMETILNFVKNADLIGVNALSENFVKVAALVNFLKNKVKAPIIWGGAHATLNPSDCLLHANFVCIGEGEEALVEFAERIKNNQRMDGIKNILTPADNVDKVTLRPPVNLDSIEPFNYELLYQYMLQDNKIRNVEERDFNGVFLSYTSRGCPFGCSYCCNSIINEKIYRGHSYCRQRNINAVLNELKNIKSRFSSCKIIWFNEADFLTGKKVDVIDDFSKRYKKEIGTPFGIWTNPACIDEKKIKALKEAGLIKCQSGK